MRQEQYSAPPQEIPDSGPARVPAESGRVSRPAPEHVPEIEIPKDFSSKKLSQLEDLGKQAEELLREVETIGDKEHVDSEARRLLKSIYGGDSQETQSKSAEPPAHSAEIPQSRESLRRHIIELVEQEGFQAKMDTEAMRYSDTFVMNIYSGTLGSRRPTRMERIFSRIGFPFQRDPRRALHIGEMELYDRNGTLEVFGKENYEKMSKLASALKLKFKCHLKVSLETEYPFIGPLL